MRIVFMGKDKPSVLEALRYLVDRDVEVAAVVAPPRSARGFGDAKLVDCARFHGLPVASDTDIYDHLSGAKTLPLDLEEIDMVISFLFWKRLKRPLIDLGRLGCLNFHSAPLPEYRGWGVYNAAILNGETRWGVTAHFVDEDFDTGEIIKVRRFGINPRKETAFSLEQRSQRPLLELFQEIIDMVNLGKPLPRTRQDRNAGTTYTKKETLKHEIVTIKDSPELIEAKMRAFWYPPNAAKIILNGEEYFLIGREIMSDISDRYRT